MENEIILLVLVAALLSYLAFRIGFRVGLSLGIKFTHKEYINFFNSLDSIDKLDLTNKLRQYSKELDKQRKMS